MPQALTLTSTSPAPGSGTGTSATSRRPEPPAGLRPCWLRSGTGSPEQAGGGAAEHEFFVGAKCQGADLADGVVGAHVERAVRAEQHLPGTGVADQVCEQVVVVGDRVVVEPAQCGVRASGGPGPCLRPDGEEIGRA